MGRFGLAETRATAIIDEMKRVVADGWENEVRRLGGTVRDCETIRTAFVYDGFDHAPSE